MLNRRRMLLGAPLLAALPVRGLSVLQGEGHPEGASPSGQKLSPAVLAAVSSNLVSTAGKLHRGNLTQGDLTATIAMIDLLRNHFIEVGFDKPFKDLMRSVDPAAVDSTESPLIGSTYQAFAKADSTWTRDEVKQAFARVIQPEDIPAQVVQLENRGLTPVLADVEQMLAERARSLPVAFAPRAGQAYLRRASCAGTNLAAGLLGVAGTTLAGGCLLPEPAWPVICPAAGVIGFVIGVVGGVVLIFCG